MSTKSRSVAVERGLSMRGAAAALALAGALGGSAVPAAASAYLVPAANDAVGRTSDVIGGRSPACLAAQTVASKPNKLLHRALWDVQARWSFTMRKRHGEAFARIRLAQVQEQRCEKEGAMFVCRITAVPCGAERVAP